MQKYHPKMLISGPQSRLTAWLLGLVLTSQGYGQLYVLANLAWGEHTAGQQNLFLSTAFHSSGIPWAHGLSLLLSPRHRCI
ncbi:hypothetical protein CI102_3933 [Trichoderma harzianum]|nr:hypothetical protein CI102_3933 [Trichoderma harzianum]